VPLKSLNTAGDGTRPHSIVQFYKILFKQALSPREPDTSAPQIDAEV